jgi:hypothetical protein
MVVHFTWRATGNKNQTILPYHHSRKQSSPLIERDSDRVMFHIISWSSKGNLVLVRKGGEHANHRYLVFF